MNISNLTLFSWIGLLKGFYLLTPIFSLFLLAKGVPLSVIVAANVAWSFGAFVGEMPTGLFADRYGQKLSMICGYLLEAVGILLVFTAPGVITLYVYYGMSGLAYAFLSGSEEALLYETVRKEKAGHFQKVYARFLSNEQIGFASAAVIAGVVYQYYGLASFPWLIACSALAFLAAALLGMGLRNYVTTSVAGMDGSSMWMTLQESFGLIRQNKTIFTLTIIGFLTVSGQYLLQGVYQPYFELNQVPAVWLGVALALGTMLNVLLMRYVYLLEEYASLEKILLGLNLTMGALFVLMSVLVHPAFLVGIFVLLNGLFGIQQPIVSDYINPRVDSRIRSTVLSGISFVKRCFEIPFGLALGTAVGWWGTEVTLALQGLYLILGIMIGYYLLIRCGCTYKVRAPEIEELEFSI